MKPGQMRLSGSGVESDDERRASAGFSARAIADTPQFSVYVLAESPTPSGGHNRHAHEHYAVAIDELPTASRRAR